jgi:hypothetical protein
LGNVRGLSTLSPVLPERAADLVRRLRVLRYVPGLARPLIELDFVHFARWTILDALPPTRGTGGWAGLRSKYLLFEGTYDGDQDDYLQTFADVIPHRIADIWSSCVGFEERVRRVPSARDRAMAPAEFITFVAANQLDVLDFYAAYEDSTTTIRQAIAMHDLGSDARDLRDQEAFAKRTQEVDAMALGPRPARLSGRERLRALYDPWKRAARDRYGVYPVTLAAPLVTRGADDSTIVEQLRHDFAAAKPLERLAGTNTHFARVAFVPRSLTDVGQRGADRLDAPFLLYTSDAWGGTYRHIAAIHATLGDDVWGGCVGYRPAMRGDLAAFQAWFDARRLDTRYYLSGYPPRTVAEIEAAVARRHAARARYAPPAPVRA